MVDKGPRLIGTLLEQRYRVDALLARGGMSAVYRGLDTRLDRPVAIKVMDSRFAADQSFVDRFEREARSAAKIHHPNVVAVHDQGLDGDHVYLVMELVDGGTLRDLLAQRGSLPTPLAVAIMEPVLSALGAAHAAGLIHRDVKPENVLISSAGVVKVADFGLVRAISSVGTTKSSVILGTVSYLSPEQVEAGSATARGDVYSAGIVLYEMLTGSPPYHGDNALTVAYRHVNADVPAASAAVPGLPAPLDELVLRATRRDPQSRPEDGTAFLQELRAVREQLSLPRMRVPSVAAPPPDETVPVSGTDLDSIKQPSEPVSPEAPDEPTMEAVAPVDPEATVRVPAVQLPASPPQGMTVVRPAPSGFSASGPQGTRAMLRSDLERVIDSAAANPLPTGPHPVPHVPTGPPFPHQQHPHHHQQQPPHEPPPNRTRKIVLWSTAGVVALAVLITSIWWFTSGRYTAIPTVHGKDTAAAEKALRDADLSPNTTTVRHNDIPSGEVIGTDPGAGAEALRGDQVKLIVSAGRPVVPDVPAGSTQAQAEQAIRAAELQPLRDDGKNVFDEKIAKGAVVKLDPAPGTKLLIGERVIMVLSKGPAPKPVPDLRGKSRDEAFEELTKLGFEPFDGPGEFSPDIDNGKVVRTDPAAGTKIAPEGSKRVAVIVSTSVTVPDLSNRTVPEAQDELAKVGLHLDLGVFSNPNGRILTQSPGPGSRVEKDSKVGVIAF
ncbi:Probable serine/threonine-protein kinase pknL [Alloactinosynnema sp. L-07]|uniref:Stk1 family PASTA domain-containing Ser/Thr kinase n=1 Tax=Alloactinosynnema sp. L-07 TaxID=1653480 RepID=UPI00065EFA6F|nr:Stk1 family PASTA domain-containing Ser/Thr kinase [Alloactinosynnema sp. L-07]CRK55724.1 Probable serine/threonine-protein kinase pknL [Alloactinosynnema sp. L-07]